MSDATFRHGSFVWRELLTQDPVASGRFYAEVFGWKADVMSMGAGGDYAMMKAGEALVGGVMKVPMPDLPSYWGGYVSVDDVAATAAKISAGGGKVLAGPGDVPGMGRFVTFMDPQGGVASAWRSARGDGPAPKPGVGEFCWEQLNCADPQAAGAFYAQVFGWTQKPFAGQTVLSAGAADVASMMPAPAGVPTHWLHYVVVDKLADARARVSRAGGKVMLEALTIPTVGTIAVIQDNVGAMLGMLEPAAG